MEKQMMKLGSVGRRVEIATLIAVITKASITASTNPGTVRIISEKQSCQVAS
jgi:hypothetical protein